MFQTVRPELYNSKRPTPAADPHRPTPSHNLPPTTTAQVFFTSRNGSLQLHNARQVCRAPLPDLYQSGRIYWRLDAAVGGTTFPISHGALSNLCALTRWVSTGCRFYRTWPWMQCQSSSVCIRPAARRHDVLEARLSAPTRLAYTFWRHPCT
jgi:hypothetical protein